MIECERESIAESMLDSRLAERAAAGWNIASTVQHHLQTIEESPIWIVFWERTT